jgi:hypothetical protein
LKEFSSWLGRVAVEVAAFPSLFAGGYCFLEDSGFNKTWFSIDARAFGFLIATLVPVIRFL